MTGNRFNKIDYPPDSTRAIGVVLTIEIADSRSFFNPVLQSLVLRSHWAYAGYSPDSSQNNSYSGISDWGTALALMCVMAYSNNANTWFGAASGSN
jgi:hypothetical protein